MEILRLVAEGTARDAVAIWTATRAFLKETLKALGKRVAESGVSRSVQSMKKKATGPLSGVYKNANEHVERVKKAHEGH